MGSISNTRTSLAEAANLDPFGIDAKPEAFAEDADESATEVTNGTDAEDSAHGAYVARHLRGLVAEIDSVFGRGYAQANPALLIGYLQFENGLIVSERIRDAINESSDRIASEISNLASEVSALDKTLMLNH